jgi:hypothetical protein
MILLKRRFSQFDNVARHTAYLPHLFIRQGPIKLNPVLHIRATMQLLPLGYRYLLESVFTNGISLTYCKNVSLSALYGQFFANTPPVYLDCDV